MNHVLSLSAQKVQDQLVHLGYNLKVIEFQETTRTSTDAAARIGCTIGQIVKSLIFKCRKSGKPVLILTSGANRVDVKKIADLTGEPIDRADPEFVRSITGFAIGGIPPIGHSTLIDTYLDEDLLKYETLWAAAGTPNAVFELSPRELHAMTSARIIRVKEE
ncbi:MAG: prolyl-tRNA editing protein [Chloroflexi bacterium GWB2_49_20]|nr:MAG: prolyl-tRNA editing protein [Chloroflexi bacterium GWB2_49_20]OGN78614.1 MAG: prolyl-tRNA editing protein [Chloroflexi bacterium GWC2_49_37]OGN85716.1 MAG: prolyl-tRNA editing protein [Chloroflexi bacterium GWD2_49_16]HBG75061.1 prolyl-tRNA editing protein [Anaerolineae bacterium]HCC78086.1 prolyl-tRNA editing protein [Anaerolineae bacterium]